MNTGYDHRGRVTEKILPGDAPAGVTVQYWYDRADRTAYVRDAALGSRYRFFLYDRLGRLCVQGTCGNRYGQCDTVLAVTSYAGGSGGVCQTGYTAPYTISDPQLEIVNYYDNYGFTSNNNLSNIMPVVSINTDQQRYAVGSLTGQVAYTTGGPAGGTLGTVSVYDRKGRVVRSVRRGLGGRTEDVHTAYSFTDAVDTVRAEVGVGYGSAFTANTVYTYQKGRKTKMAVSVFHGMSVQSRLTEYTYDPIGRLSGRKRQLTGTGRSTCTYAYDVHGWLRSIKEGEFRELLRYADGLDGGCWNGNISTVKWKTDGSTFWQGYNLKYDGCNRLYSAAYGSGDNLTSERDYFSEYADYDCNGNVTNLRRRGLTDNLHGAFGLVDNLYMTYTGNRLTSVRDNASHLYYAGATDFDGMTGENPLTYDASGALTSDAGRGMARIDYDHCGNPVRIQFTDGSVTRYIYSAAGEKLRVTHLTAVPNITVPIGTARELAPSEILSADSTDYLLGGTLTMRNGRIDKYLFDEGYCQASKVPSNPVKDKFTFYYFDRDHLGSVRQVIIANGTDKGTVAQRMNYYPSGLQFCDGTTDSDKQPRWYNGKEYDKMHGLCTYDYGARQYNPVTARWDRMDPLCEKYYSVSPYAYCGNNPVNAVDPDGRDIYMLFYTTGNNRGDETFKAAAETRKYDIEKSKEFNTQNDIVIMSSISDMGQLGDLISDIVDTYSEKYGNTAEFSIWSHASYDGPCGTVETSQYREDETQLSLEGWSKINFNWGENATANFFGCNTGNAKKGTSFSTNVSALENFKDVSVHGQISYAYPSIYVDARQTNANIVNGKPNIPTYFVGSKKTVPWGRFMPTYTKSYPMRTSKNGYGIVGDYYQKGRRLR